MTSAGVARGGLWLLMVGALATAWGVLRPHPPGVVFATPTPIGSPRVPGPVPADSLARLVRHDPFRLGRAPAPVPYDPARGDQPPEPAPAIQRPTLALTGLVWGGASESGALIEGLPGVDGSRLLQVGDTVGGLRVRRIGVAEVVLAGLDTVWTLLMRRPWD